jgi:hypothetical protein
LGQAIERRWRKGNGVEEEEGSVYGSALKKVTRGIASEENEGEE